jgi:hypothetical protein
MIISKAKQENYCHENFNTNGFIPRANRSSIPALMIISCKKNQKTHHNKFASKPDTFVVIGDPNMTKLYQIKFENNVKYLYVKCKDIYFSLPAKIIMAIEAFNNMPEFSQYTHFYKIDDDCKIDWNVVKSGYTPEFLSHISKNPYSGFLTFDHTGKISNCKRHTKYAHQEPNNYWATNEYKGNGVKFLRGSHYCLARHLIKDINKIWNSQNIELLGRTEVGEDVMMGKICFMLNHRPSIIPLQFLFVVDEFNNKAT